MNSLNSQENTGSLVLQKKVLNDPKWNEENSLNDIKEIIFERVENIETCMAWFTSVKYKLPNVESLVFGEFDMSLERFRLLTPVFNFNSLHRLSLGEISLEMYDTIIVAE
ncbi:hypothetical protein O9G_005617, partial [Rozella allomycis CSF55]